MDGSGKTMGGKKGEIMREKGETRFDRSKSNQQPFVD